MARKEKQGNPKKAVGYIRVSTNNQKNGPEVQRKDLERWALASKIELVAVFEDRGISGAAAIDKRPGLLAAIDALREHGAGVLAVQKRDRLARDVIAAAMVERLSARVGAVISCANGTGNGTGPEDLLMRRLLDAFAEYERAMIRGRIKATLALKKAKGEKTGGQVPFGWKVANDGKHLEASKPEQEIIRLAKELQASGLSLRAIRAELERREVFPRNGKSWSVGSVNRAIKGKVA